MSKVKLCMECSKRSYCSSLCPEAELYVSQDYVGMKELLIGLPIWGGLWPEGLEMIAFEDVEKEMGGVLTKSEMRIWYLIEIGVGKQDICKLLKIQRKTLRNKLYSIRKKLRKLEK